jgi:hypothetical protein
VTLARIRATTGIDVGPALAAVGDEAVRRGLVEPALEARLALATDAAAFASIEREAWALGYLGIARAAVRR